MKCGVCEEREQQLLDEGAGCGQVICNHVMKLDDGVQDEEKEKDTPIATDSVGGSSITTKISSRQQQRKRRRFLSPYEFNERADDKTKRRIAPIQKWRDLIVGNVYRIVKVHDLPVTIKGKDQIAHYGEFEDKNEQLVNVWLTTIIYQEIIKNNLIYANVYLKPLGRKKSIESGNEYHDFVIVTDNDDAE